MTIRNISIEALALRNEKRAKNAEQDALILQDDLLIANQQIAQLTAELAHYKAKPEEGKDNGPTS